MASPRQLAYKDRFVWHLEQVVSDIFDDCDGFEDRYVFPDLTTRIPFVMLLSQEQFTTLYSAVLTGADLSYPDTSHDVENLFLQMVTCPMNEFCAALINCLQNDADTWAALQSLLADNGYTGGVGDPNAPLSPGITGGNLLPAGYVCTDDAAFGMALAIVNAIHDATLEVLQLIEVATNPVELASELADNVPGVGMIASATDVAAWIQDTAVEAYELAWSTVTRDELACLLWCDFKFVCELSLDSVLDVYMGAAGVSPPAGETLDDQMEWLIALPLGLALSTVATVSLLGLLAMRYGGVFGGFGLGIQSLETVIALAVDDSSPDWAILCDPCIETWCYEFDFSVAAYWTSGGRDPANPNSWSATYVSGEWFNNNRFIPEDKSYTFTMHIPVPAGTVVTQIDVEDEVTGDPPSSQGWSWGDCLIGTNTRIQIMNDNPQAALHGFSSRSYPISPYTIVNDAINLIIGNQGIVGLVTVPHVYKITLSGTGTDPMLSGVSC